MKKILLIFLVLFWGCTKMEIEPTPPPAVQKIFSVKESRVTDGQSIHFDLPTDGGYILTLIDKESGQVVSRERFTGKMGENIKKIYTNSLQSQYLYLSLEDESGKQIGKTLLLIN